MSKEKFMVDLDGNIKSEAEVAKIVRPRTETLEEDLLDYTMIMMMDLNQLIMTIRIL